MNKTIQLTDMRVGSKVILREAFGQGKPREVILEAVLSDVKNGRPGVDYADGWAYLYQIDRVVKY